jgi:hypothetical protein
MSLTLRSCRLPQSLVDAHPQRLPAWMWEMLNPVGVAKVHVRISSHLPAQRTFVELSNFASHCANARDMRWLFLVENKVGVSSQCNVLVMRRTLRSVVVPSITAVRSTASTLYLW